MALDLIWAAAVLDQATAELSAFLDEAGRRGIDQPEHWLTPAHLQELRRRMAPVQPLLEIQGGPPEDLRPRLNVYKARLLELQSILQEMNERLQQRTQILSCRHDDILKLRLWLAAYRSSG